MRLSLIRHGMTLANERRLYCGFTDLPLSDKGRLDLASLKGTVRYPEADIYITSALTRASETCRILYGREPDIIIEEFNEMNFGRFEMKSYEELKDTHEFIEWIAIGNTGCRCPGGESLDIFNARIKKGLDAILRKNVESAMVICHGGVIVYLMELFFPCQKNFYEWQPSFGRGYTLDVHNNNAELISQI